MVRHFVRDRKRRFTRLEDPPGGSDLDEYIDINNRGDTVGFHNDDQGASTTGFLRTARGRFVDIVFPGALVTGPLKINDRRQVVGICADPGGALHGFLWDDGHFRTIDLPRASSTAVLAINNRGQMAGSYIDADGAYHGFVRERNGRVRTLPDAPGADPAMGHPAGRAQRSRAGRRGCLRRSRRVARIPAGARRAEPSSTAPGRSTHAR